MDTVHDLGGVQGFGPIPNTDEDDSRLFAEEWKARIWAIAMMSMGRLRADDTGWTLDWYRHVLERLPPDLYLRMDYFEKWILAMMVTAIDEGIAEIGDFRGDGPVPEPFAYTTATPLIRQAETPGRFAPGDTIVTRRDLPSMHTRLARYMRGRRGVIERVIGPQPLPELAAEGTVLREQTYVVRFRMAELWPEAEDNGDSLVTDMWDSYIEPA
ncbi:nitrile hydratase subunit beta [Ponticoccus sp. SC2-23]|uniref:SH3-like domain-containing protein n=1 Tax=Alexandriicola marinus TaxID=2081710 RepID=UPI000FD9DD97|nr:SH3-like domain-containing protein [Alexandriicola marinus]MBM1220913.1 nitrile hydratase subunit beta [Ponticoccus sp. SC6-9]MBM1225483.1 nitrile hydratase subunit beta [Ponticoccus sp. SC6-15]MBM1227666.1 nitrile hydratase subunit beta [Ponticoccus sp. SC6-38]MBM1234696.1 nitrile hydratase subunit beta [Ponticoccus sp. SC6-45]MBM1238168.1 nitrile hydratase subunit beta [Ponticoccus sp. SC6-49]MBM1244199.1 nitrile hydratase subunit beta [Ponticoccus sp. SC2-64]MBM1248220.1 nitrile hydrat